MAYKKINKQRFEFLLMHGSSDDELRRFFSENRIRLIQKGAKVQNVPRGTFTRVAMLVQGMPPATDPILQKWFSENVSIIDAASIDEVINMFRLYEEENEELPESDGKRLSRSCLVHLFSSSPPDELVEFLRTPIGNNKQENGQESEEINELFQSVEVDRSALLDCGLSDALIALLEGKDPDEFVGNLPTNVAAFISGLHDAKEGNSVDIEHALEELERDKAARQVLKDYADRRAKSKRTHRPEITGLKIFSLEEPSRLEFDEERDEIIGICTFTKEDTRVSFVRPIAIRTKSGNYLSLAKQEHRQTIFPVSGDIVSLTGHKNPKQPKRGEIAIWKVAENENSGLQHLTNFHLSSEKTEVYEIRQVPYKSDEYDSVRECIKEQTKRNNQGLSVPLLFALRDDLIVGSHRDLSRDEGFDGGLFSWRSLYGFRFENRILVPGPLPSHEFYECEPLAASFKKLVASNKGIAEMLSKQQLKSITGLLATGEARLNKDRTERLMRELATIEEQPEARDVLFDFVMQSESIQTRVDSLVQEEVMRQSAHKERFAGELSKAEEKLADIKKQIDQQEKEQKALPKNLVKAIRTAVEKARQDAVGTLSESVVLQALIGGESSSLVERRGHAFTPSPIIRSIAPTSDLLVNVLVALGVNRKYASALELTGRMVFSTGTVLLIEGAASRIAAEAWIQAFGKGGQVFECEIGLTGDSTIRQVLDSSPESLAILDANLSPVDIYARPLVDSVQRSLARNEEAGKLPAIVMSLSDSVAALPFPSSVQAISFRITLDRTPAFLSEEDAAQILAEIEDPSYEPEAWFNSIWKPAATRIFTYLKGIPLDDAALILSAIKRTIEDSNGG